MTARGKQVFKLKRDLTMRLFQRMAIKKRSGRDLNDLFGAILALWTKKEG